MNLIERIYLESLQQFNVTGEEFLSPTRLPQVTKCRECVAILARQLTTMSYPEIAKATARANHTSVLMQYQRGARRYQEDSSFSDIVKQVGKKIGAASKK